MYNDSQLGGFNVASIPIVGGFIAKAQNTINDQVTRLKMRLADFQLIPRRVQNFRARVNQLLGAPAVAEGPANAIRDQVQAISRAVDGLDGRFATASQVASAAMSEVQRMQAGNFSLTGGATVASAIGGIEDTLKQAATIEAQLRPIEAKVLSPTQAAAAATAGLDVSSSLGVSSGSFVKLALMGGLGFLALRAFRPQRRNR